MHAEAEFSRLYLRIPSEDNLKTLNKAVSHCRSSILLLPYDYEDLKDKLAGAPSDVHVGIGIGNLYQRLTSLYGEDSLQISSEAGEGTQITVTIPLTQGEEHDAENIDR